MTTTISSKMPEGLVEEIEDFMDDDESRSAAVRRLVRAGLDAQAGPGTVNVPFPAFLAFFGWFLVMGGLIPQSLPIAGAGFLFAAGGTIYLVITQYTDL